LWLAVAALAAHAGVFRFDVGLLWRGRGSGHATRHERLARHLPDSSAKTKTVAVQET
jgi:hypothetical protein